MLAGAMKVAWCLSQGWSRDVQLQGCPNAGSVAAGAVAPGLMQQPDVIALLRAPQSPSAERPTTANPVSLAHMAQQGWSCMMKVACAAHA